MDSPKLCQHTTAVEPRAAFDLKDFEAGLWSLVEQARGWEKASASSAVLYEDIDWRKVSIERELHHLVGSYRRRLASEASLLKQLSACSNALDVARRATANAGQVASITIAQRATLAQAADFLEQKHSRLAAVTLRVLLDQVPQCGEGDDRG
ncbi:hypothetical protein [Burkholderia gladioli]|uniref:hypothetical protein n=1 Tax=Burkholderia gladioli TaxID=28095 RepID=UPI001640D2F3|nr:hypothetical protein [Burkholderia gladioli]MDN7813721.1 hypothetical protein [Burkholderia gladioli]